MEKDLNNYTKDLIINSFEMETTDTISSDDLEQMLAERVEFLLAHQLEFFFATMYRMDVNEQKIQEALTGQGEKPSLKIARLIIQRQLEKQASREKYRTDFDLFDDSF